MSKEVAFSASATCKFLLLRIIPFCLPIWLSAQGSDNYNFSKELTGGIMLHTNGFGAAGKYTLDQGRQFPLVAGLDILYIRHPKEARTRNPYFDNTTPYVYGKQYNLFEVRPYLGSQQKLTIRVLPRDVRLRLNYSVGFDLAILKPVVLGIIHYDPGGMSYHVEYERYDPIIHGNQNFIFGNSGFFDGFDQLKFQPGASLKAGLEFQSGTDTRLVQLVEIGVMLDFFAQEIPIFAFGENQFFFPNLFVQFSLGQRW